jgi:hypothetical protein
MSITEKTSDKPSGGQEDVQDTRPRSPLTGAPVPNGRPKGVPNKLTRTFKAAAEEAFEKGGGVAWLVKLMNGTASDRAAVLGLYGRLIPHQLVGQVDHRVKVELSWLGGRSIGKTVLDMQSPAGQQKALANQEVTDVVGRQVPDMRQIRDEDAESVRGADHADD